jgi:two-component system LytT family response regulator
LSSKENLPKNTDMKERFLTVVIDRDYGALESLRLMMGLRCPGIEIAAVARTADEGHELIKEFRPDVVFLDFSLPGNTAFDLLDCFPERGFSVVGMADDPEVKIKALKAGVVDFLLKPVRPAYLEDLCAKIRDARTSTSNGSQVNDKVTSIALTHSGGFQVVELSNIMRLQADDNYTKVFSAEGKRYLISRPLKDFERKLPEEMFIRPHKSHMINMFFLKEFIVEDGGVAVLRDGTKIPVSKRKMSVFMSAVKRFSLVIRK